MLIGSIESDAAMQSRLPDARQCMLKKWLTRCSVPHGSWDWRHPQAQYPAQLLPHLLLPSQVAWRQPSQHLRGHLHMVKLPDAESHQSDSTQKNIISCFALRITRYPAKCRNCVAMRIKTGVHADTLSFAFGRARIDSCYIHRIFLSSRQIK